MAGMSVKVDSGEVASLRSIDIDHQPSVSKVVTEWINLMREGERAVQALPGILQEIADFKLWDLNCYGSPRNALQYTHILDMVNEVDDAGLSDLVDLFIKEVEQGGDGKAQVEQISEYQHARANPLGSRGAPEGNDNRAAERENKVRNTNIESGTQDRTYTLRRLARDRPDLLDRVEAGELSPNAAAIEAGFRKKKTPAENARHWLARCSEEERAEILGNPPQPDDFDPVDHITGQLMDMDKPALRVVRSFIESALENPW